MSGLIYERDFHNTLRRDVGMHDTTKPRDEKRFLRRENGNADYFAFSYTELEII